MKYAIAVLNIFHSTEGTFSHSNKSQWYCLLSNSGNEFRSQAWHNAACIHGGEKHFRCSLSFIFSFGNQALGPLHLVAGLLPWPSQLMRRRWPGLQRIQHWQVSGCVFSKWAPGAAPLAQWGADVGTQCIYICPHMNGQYSCGYLYTYRHQICLSQRWTIVWRCSKPPKYSLKKYFQTVLCHKFLQHWCYPGSEAACSSLEAVS